MTNICVFTNTLLKGGAEKQAVLLSKALSDRYRVLLVVYYGNLVSEEYIKIIEGFPVEIKYLSGSHFTKFIKFYYFLRNHKVNILFTYLLTTNFVGGFIGKIAGVKYKIGGIRSSKIDKKKLCLQRFLHNHVNEFTIFNNHQGLVNLCKNGFNISKSVMIPNCFDLETKLIKRPLANKIKILSVGRFHKAKDYPTAIKSLIELIRFYPDVEYTIIGYGSLEKDIQNLIIENNAEEYIKLVINPDNIKEYYISSDIYLMTSIFEGMSNTLLEAMSYSLPLVATNVGDNGKLVKEGFNGYLSPPKDIQAITKSLLKLCESQEMRKQFGKNSYKHLNDNFSLDKFKSKYFNFIDNLRE